MPWAVYAGAFAGERLRVGQVPSLPSGLPDQLQDLPLVALPVWLVVLSAAEEIGWLRLTMVLLDDQPIACHLGMALDGVHHWYKPAFDVRFARYSPGEVLLRNLILAAREDGAQTFDFGLGAEPFKLRFATSTPTVTTVGLYPRAAMGLPR